MAVLGPDHAETLSARALLGSAHLAMGNSSEALRLLEESVRRGERVLGPGHLEVLGWKVSLAEAAGAAGRKKEARAMAESALVRLENGMGPNHPRVVQAREVVEKLTTAGAVTKAGTR
jgi:hypothetical protein